MSWQPVKDSIIYLPTRIAGKLEDTIKVWQNGSNLDIHVWRGMQKYEHMVYLVLPDDLRLCKPMSIHIDWFLAPKWAQWATYSPSGYLEWWEYEPELKYSTFGTLFWSRDSLNPNPDGNGYGKYARHNRKPTELPIGIDWRTLKFAKPKE